MLQNISNGITDGGLTFQPIKIIVGSKGLSNYTNNDLTDLYLFKDDLIVKYEATKAQAGDRPYGTGIMLWAMQNMTKGDCMAYQKATMADYYTLPQNYVVPSTTSGTTTTPTTTTDKTKWHCIYDDLVLAILLLSNSRNDGAKTSL